MKPRASRGVRPGWKGVGLAAVAALIVAEGAVWLLRPRHEIEPASVPASAYFSHEQIARAKDYADGQRLLFLGTIALEGGALVLLAAGRPKAVRRWLEAGERRPLRGAALAGAGLSAGLVLLTLPLAAASHERAVDAGLSTQDFGSWLADVAKSAGIGAVFAAGGAALLIGLLRRFGGRWWIPASVVAVALEVVFVWLAPVVLAPLFNRFDPLPHGQARSEVLSLSRRAGVKVDQVYRIDASRRSTTLNAYVDGIGSSRRVVLYDNLLEPENRKVVRPVVAHELGHVAGNDIPRGMAFFAILVPLGLLASGLAAARLAERSGVARDSVASLPAYALAIGVATFVLGVPGNQLSRAIESRADSFALGLTDDPRGVIELQRRLALTNLADPNPPGALRLLFGTHPTTMQRIGAAVAFERDRPR
jgi:STE24 endopeptidase